jgi:hypothetical protein
MTPLTKRPNHGATMIASSPASTPDTIAAAKRIPVMKRPAIRIYRKCSCGETAHEFTPRTANEPANTTVFACRNCGRRRVYIAGWRTGESS